MPHTNRGFEIYGEFKDSRGIVVRIQESSAIGDPCCWIFVDDPEKVYSDGKPAPHLTREQARLVANALLRFADDESDSEEKEGATASERKNNAIPYRCTECGAAYCKLWRQYQTCADATRLLCQPCALKDQKMDTPDSEASIGWLVAAVPTPEGDTFWGYTSIPTAGLAWWRALPTARESDKGGPQEAP